jgi:predicted neutral ceramidase superfamily lipid hydrolase
LKKYLLILLTTTLLLSTSLMVAAQPTQQFPWRPRLNPEDPETLERIEQQIENYITFRLVISTLNMVLYGYILYLYAQLYNETRSKFSLGLMSLSAVLLIYSITSNPLLFWVLRGSGTQQIWFDVFNVIPDVFASIAAIIMIYLSRT